MNIEPNKAKHQNIIFTVCRKHNVKSLELTTRHIELMDDCITEYASRSASPDGWVPYDKDKLPLETPIIIEHKYGIEAIQFFNHKWTYWYTGKEVDTQVFETAIRFMIVKKNR